MWTKQDVVEVAIKLLAVISGFRLAVVGIALPFHNSRGAGEAFGGLLIAFVIAVLMVWKTKKINGWLFRP